MANVVLNLPEYKFSFKQENNKTYIFDEVRRKYLVMTPEEWVRQNFVKYLVQNLGYPAGLISLEIPLKINRTDKRSDVVVFNHEGKILMLIECKAPHIKISQNTFDQAAVYNLNFKASYLVVTNGMAHYCCKVDYENNKWDFLSEVPGYNTITKSRD